MEDKTLRSLWCDGFVPERFLLDDPIPQITGRAWIATGPRKQDRWEFTLLLDATTRAREDIPWGSLLPSEDLTGWLAVDLDVRRIVINPLRTVAT